MATVDGKMTKPSSPKKDLKATVHRTPPKGPENVEKLIKDISLWSHPQIIGEITT